ncbi:MAG: sigma-70 family RNA polymerase sigma factor [Clostridiales bacterium]|nr:sigma-70 family RNA polymerase sigma factor [Clostridiales bacterium]
MRTTREQVNIYLSRLKRGEDCLKEFIDYSRGYLQYIAYKYLVDKSLVEDVIFSAYDKILRALSSFDGKQNGLAWIVKITQNEAYKFNRDESGSVPLDGCEGAAIPTDEVDGLTRYDVERAVAKLDEDERKIIECKIYMGMTVREIAKQENIPKSTVAYILKRALKKLEKLLS